MKLKVKELADLSGISVRMLHHYHKIGLLNPSSVTEAGYRLYGEYELERLQQILFFKELDFPLNDIRSILDSPGFNKVESLKCHRDLLLKKAERLNKLIDTINNTIVSIEGGSQMKEKEMFGAFNMDDIDIHKKKYADEVKRKYGDSSAYEECDKKTASYSKQDWKRIIEKGNEIFSSIASIMDKGPQDQEVQNIVSLYRNYISENFYNCTLEIYRGLGEMYVYDERFTKNIDKHGVGLSAFLRDAIAYYCDNHQK